MIFDTHAHYDISYFDEDREAVLASLLPNNIGRVVNVASGLPSIKTTLDLAKNHKFIFAAVGVHPDEIGALREEDMDQIRQEVLADRRSGQPKIVAIGEIGLDYHGREIPREIQQKWFRRQMALAEELDLPVIVHSRDAAQDTYEVLKDGPKKEGAGIVHCFSYGKEMAKLFLDLGYYVALGGVVTFKNGRVAKEVAAYVPSDRLLLETDCPFLTPEPHRGERNDSTHLNDVVPVIAALRGVTEEQIIKETWENGCRLYRLPKE